MLLRNRNFLFPRLRMSVRDALSAFHSLLTRQSRARFALRSEAEEILEACKARYVREMTEKDDVTRSDPPASVYITLPLTVSAPTENNAKLREENRLRSRALIRAQADPVGHTEVIPFAVKGRGDEIRPSPVASGQTEIAPLAVSRGRVGVSIPAERQAEAVCLLV
jgi:hypothetical protein